MDKIYHFSLNSALMQQAYYFRHVLQITGRPEGGGHRSMSTSLNTPLSVTTESETSLSMSGFICIIKNLKSVTSHSGGSRGENPAMASVQFGYRLWPLSNENKKTWGTGRHNKLAPRLAKCLYPPLTLHILYPFPVTDCHSFLDPLPVEWFTLWTAPKAAD